MNELTEAPQIADTEAMTPVVLPNVTGGPITFGGDVPKLFGALARAQAIIGNAHKNSKNPHFGSKYADLAEVWDAIQAALPQHGLCLIQMPHTEGKRVSLTTVLGHEAGGWVSAMATAEARDGGPQAMGSVITYLRRYCASAMVGVVQADDDGNAGQGVNAPKQDSRKPAPPPSGSMREHAEQITGRRPAQEQTPETLKLIGPDGKEYQIGKSPDGMPPHLHWFGRWKGALQRLRTPEAVAEWFDANGKNIEVIACHWPEVAGAATKEKDERIDFLDFPGNRPSQHETAGAK